MIKTHALNLFLVFFLCFSSFLFGWVVAVYIIPGGEMGTNDSFQKEVKVDTKINRKKDSQKPLKPDNQPKTAKPVPFFEEMKENILLLFDPYQTDSALQRDTYLKKKESYIKNPQPVSIKKDFKNSDKKKHLNKGKQESFTAPLALSERSYSLAGDSLVKVDKAQLKEIQKEYDKKNREQLTSILEDQNVFTRKGKVSFLINVFSDKEEALDYVKKMKADYPLWSFLIKAHPDHIRIYLGPISSKSKALEFKNTVPQPLPFSLDFLEEVSLPIN